MRKIRLSSFSIITLFVALAIIGSVLIPMLSIQLTPSSSSSSIQVSYSWSDASAKVLEQEVTSKLEGLFNGVKGVKEVSSSSNKGYGSIQVNFKKNTDMDAVRFELATLIRQAYPKLPQGVSYPRLSMSLSGEGQSTLLSYSINAHESPYFIKKYIDDYLVPKLAVKEGVSSVNTYGASPYEWVITYDAHRLFELGLSVGEISTAIDRYFSKHELGKAKIDWEESGEVREISVRLEYGNNRDLDWNRIPIRKVEDRVVYLQDVAKVRFQEGPVQAYYRINGKNMVNMVLTPEKGANTIRLAEQLREDIIRLSQSLPTGYEVKLTYDSTSKLSEELQKIKMRSVFSLLILLLMAIALYRDIKYLSILFCSIAINLLIGVIFYYFFQVELQLYSFAGITISFGIIIDNTVIMLDHLKKNGDKKVFLAILSATLTTIAAVVVVFMLEESQRANLADFAIVIAINLGVSLVVALYFVPALMDKFNLKYQPPVFSRKAKKKPLWLAKRYERFLLFCKRKPIRWVFFVLIILGFGIPLHLAPQKLEGNGKWINLYNHTLGNSWFSEKVRPDLEKYIGGSLRLFIENVFESSYYAEPERTSLRVMGTMPEGHTIDQLNDVIIEMERYIASFKEVSLFETQISSHRNGSISIFFKDDYESGSFPYTLKNLLQEKAVSLDGLDWSITGVGRGFSNALGNDYKSNHVELRGYNYDNLYAYAEMLGDQLIEQSNGRVKEIEIGSGGWNTQVLQEYYLDFYPEELALAQVGAGQLYNALRNQLHSGNLQSIVHDNELQEVKLVSSRYERMNVWDLQNEPLVIGENQYKLGKLAGITRRKTGNAIHKENQEYKLVVAFDFIGPSMLAQKFTEDRIKELAEILPIGYTVERPSYGYWNRKDKKQYYYLFVIIGIIFFICAILLESLQQPFAIIAMIPISFIGVFLTFYLFDFNFDQGGYASFILLSGISVNAALYIVNDFNNLRKEFPAITDFHLYLKAYNRKIVPIFITIISTVGGLIPFVWGGQKEVFWFSFAIGSMGGLIFSIIGIWVYLPLLIVGRETK